MHTNGCMLKEQVFIEISSVLDTVLVTRVYDNKKIVVSLTLQNLLLQKFLNGL
jgi:hypothetical protein